MFVKEALAVALVSRFLLCCEGLHDSLSILAGKFHTPSKYIPNAYLHDRDHNAAKGPQLGKCILIILANSKFSHIVLTVD